MGAVKEKFVNNIQFDAPLSGESEGCENE